MSRIIVHGSVRYNGPTADHLGELRDEGNLFYIHLICIKFLISLVKLEKSRKEEQSRRKLFNQDNGKFLPLESNFKPNCFLFS